MSAPLPSERIQEISRQFDLMGVISARIEQTAEESGAIAVRQDATALLRGLTWLRNEVLPEVERLRKQGPPTNDVIIEGDSEDEREADVQVCRKHILEFCGDGPCDICKLRESQTDRKWMAHVRNDLAIETGGASTPSQTSPAPVCPNCGGTREEQKFLGGFVRPIFCKSGFHEGGAASASQPAEK